MSRRPTPGPGLPRAGATVNPRTGPVPFYGPGATTIGDPVESQGELVRPYAMTGGRTRPREVIAIEALVSTASTPAAYAATLPEHRRILELCQELKSVAEISALLGMPLGVARILVADLAEAGLVVIHRPSHGEEAPDVSLLQRVLDGLRRL
ncbi:DUF742 domain-containing protein [Streptomyces sp. NPDC059371]|uniref:DUF742 domain-containing protein n=1 Tax=Streptomyces sp. NPDC059371 TaxID=3346812 RepID=UPI0036CCD0EB